jgi:hypothetical protein
MYFIQVIHSVFRVQLVDGSAVGVLIQLAQLSEQEQYSHAVHLRWNLTFKWLQGSIELAGIHL